jgi:predicted anti-sigma-YlaC factor YlaD
MTEHIHEDLPQLLRGEADRPMVLAAAAHLRECEDCRQELISATVAHASLSSAARFAPVTVTEPAPPAQLPDLSAVFAQAREEAEAPAPRRRPSWLYPVAAAAVGLGVGVGATAIAVNSGSSPSARTVQLAAFGHGSESASARVIGGDQMRLDAAALPSAGTGKLYEVWLTNGARTQMYAVGSLGTDRKGSFTVPSDLMSEYTAIEVSVQPITTSSYSGVSVLRGNYA